jgi:hypothetical protein
MDVAVKEMQRVPREQNGAPVLQEKLLAEQDMPLTLQDIKQVQRLVQRLSSRRYTKS